MKTILYVAERAGGANAISSVYKRLANENYNSVCLGGPISSKIFSENNIPFESLEEIEKSETFPSSLEKMLNKINPKLILTGVGPWQNYWTIDRAMIKISQKRGIPTVQLTDMWGDFKGVFEDPQKNLCHGNIVCAVDNYLKNILKERGIPEKNIVITGNPYFDSLGQKAKSFGEYDRKRLRREFGFSDKDFIVSFGSQPIIKDNRVKELGFSEYDSFDILLQSIQNLQKKYIKVFLRSHPSEQEGNLRSVSERYSFVNVISNPNEGDIREAILVAHVNSTMFSTSAFESIVMRVPNFLIQPNATEAAKQMPFIKRFKKYLPTYGTMEEVGKAIENYLDQRHLNKTKEMLEEVEKEIGINSTENVVNIIKKLI